MKPKPSLASLTPLAATLSLLAPTHADSETWSGATNGTWDTSTANWLTDGSNNLFESADDAHAWFVDQRADNSELGWRMEAQNEQDGTWHFFDDTEGTSK